MRASLLSFSAIGLLTLATSCGSNASGTTPADQPNIVFVTSTTYQPGALGGLSGADSACQARAAEAGLTGTYRAWLSTDGTNAVNAIARLGTARGWVRPDGKPFVDTIEELAVGKIMYPPRLDENGNDLGQVAVITNTAPNGTLNSSVTTCGNYTDLAAAGTVRMGWASAGSTLFTAFLGRGCSADAHLYCFGIDRSIAVSPTPVTGRHAFITNASFTPGGGVTAADALCASEAGDAGLAGTFLAVLATTTASAKSRFDTTGAPWVRADGLALVPTAAALFDATYLDVAANMNAAGTESFGNNGVWSGASTWKLVGTAATTCNDYTSTTGNTGVGGRAGDTNTAILTGMDNSCPCNADYIKLLCLEN